MDTSHVDPPGSNYQVLSHSAKNQNQMATSVAVGWFWVGVECVMALTLSIVGREPAVAVGYLALGATTYPDISATRRNLGETLLLTFSLIWLFHQSPLFPGARRGRRLRMQGSRALITADLWTVPDDRSPPTSCRRRGRG